MNIGEKLQDWTLLPISENQEVPNVNDFQEKPLLILFFYMGCPGCKGRAIPFANRIVYEDVGVAVVGIHTRFEGRVYSDDELEKAKEEFHIRFPVYRDQPEATTFKAYQAGGTPHWILIDVNGVVLQSIFGSDPNNALLRLDLKIKELTKTI
ncbi:peroxiredoxin family protein [Joostella sp. CR20]|uniref:peroxiredoxin family protein n=1 Tax=Joostella sp. CR20 TaxID=2804312 RepID=UPI00313AA170